MAKRCDVCGKGKMYGNKVTFQIKKIIELGLQTLES